jgi:hypothetical protein
MPAPSTLHDTIRRRFLLALSITALGLTNPALADPPVVASGSAASADKQLDPRLAAPREFESVNKLKQLGIAMHNYHDIHRHFPPAVVIGPDGKTPHSWRVELLPFLDEKRVYDYYRLNEPWDSPHNKLVLSQMPEVLRSPFADENSTNSGYYALVGQGTLFDGKKGIRIRDITDGTSATLQLVEAKRDIPWTKPADIPFDPDKPVPQIGGFVKGHFMALCADGRCGTFHFEDFKGDDLKWAIMRNDGHKLDLPSLVR